MRTTDKADGDFAIALPVDELASRRAAVVDLPWVWLRQVHGADVVEVTAGNASSVCGTEADALVTREPGLALAIHTADCVPVVLTSPEGVLGVAHAGWRGLVEGVLDATVDAMVDLGATGLRIDYATGPHIGPECYEFGEDELTLIEDELLPARWREQWPIRSTTRSGGVALDLDRTVQLAVGRAMHVHKGELDRASAAGWGSRICTACEAERFYSHRARGETGRMATVAWLEAVS